MGLSIATTIFLFVVCLGGGIAIGVIFSRVKSTHSETPPDKDNKKVEKKDALPVKRSQVHGEATEALHAWMNNAGETWLEMGGQHLDNNVPLQDEQKKKLLKFILEMRSWLDEPAVPELVPTPSPRQQVQGSPLLGRFGRPKVVTPVTESPQPQAHLRSIVEQIEEILQSKLTGTPFEDQNIHLLEGRGGEVIVQVGLDKFVGVDTVTNANIKDLIRQAVAEWEKSSK